jgi:hypothetical protein
MQRQHRHVHVRNRDSFGYRLALQSTRTSLIALYAEKHVIRT